MSKRFDLPFLLRLLSFAMLFAAPGLYIPDILPLFVLPVVACTVILLTPLFDRFRIRLIPSFLLASLLLLLAVSAVTYLLSRLHSTAADSLLLHVRLASRLFLMTGTATCFFTLLYLRGVLWKRIEPLVLAALLCLLFWSQANHSITLFSHPIHATAFILLFMLLQLVQLLTVTRTGRRQLASLILFLPVLLVAVFLIVRAYNALSVTNNGGLIQPTLFRFDFSPYLSLQSEIKMNDNLVLIVRTREENANNLLRRVYLSGWNTRKGFYEAAAPGEEPQIKDVPPKPSNLPHRDFLLRAPAEQEYFIVNFDPSSLIAMDYPVAVTPYRLWNSAAFNGAYAVTSESTGFIPFELYDSPAPTGSEAEGLSREALDFYTELDSENRALLGDLSLSLTEHIDGYYDKILALTTFLRDGDFRYSLKPGTAPDGNQLKYFLFDSKKGYCTYFAFSLTLMLRSIGIPSRVAAGFFLQPDSGALDYYPVRANMAHAWVEVFFPRYGWIAFDPTTTQIAEGEEILFSGTPGGDEFIQLLNEIIDKRNLLTAASADETETGTETSLSRFLAALLTDLRQGILFFAFLVLALALPARALYRTFVLRFSRNSRKVVLFAAGRMYALLRRKGYRQKKGESSRVFILSLHDPDAFALYELAQKARYAPVCTAADALLAKQLLGSMRRNRRGFRPFFGVFLLLTALCAIQPLEAESAPELLSRAQEALAAENWENAITILTEGIRQYPEDASFHYSLGNLYFDKSLYAPAFKELLLAEDLGFPGTELYSRLSDTAGFLNKDEEALVYLRRYLEAAPDDLYAWSNFGWLCYKTHRIDEGITRLRSTVETLGPDGNLYVGLGNLYTAAFNYPEAKKYYTLAIRIAEEKKQPYLSSIYYYNRSILEEVFYRFDLAYEDTAKSLEAAPRSSGYLMQGELELRRLNFAGAFNHYLKALALDSTPLAALGLADTLVQAGYPDEAERYLRSVRTKADYSWIANYGTTITQYRADLQKLYLDVYKFRSIREKRKTVHNLSTFVFRAFNRGKFALYRWYHEAVYRIHNKNVARHYEESEKEYNRINGLGLYVNSFYFLAFDRWQKTATPYLDRAASIETGYVAAAKPSYLYEQGALIHDLSLLDESISTLDPVWERQYLSMALAKRILLTPAPDRTRQSAYIQDLYDLDPAAFLYNDIVLPVRIIQSSGASPQAKKQEDKIRKLLSGKGFQASAESRFELTINVTETASTLSLKNGNTNRTVYAQVVHKKTASAADRAELLNSFIQKVFRTDLGI